MLVVEQLHIVGREGEQVGPQGDEPHVEGDAQQSYREEDSKKTEFTKSYGPLNN